ncbi:Ferritin-like protein 2 [Klebsiella pneumoniae]|nr:Ferritin-like protein 2 [Klebsiella pneumoniae]SVT14467.1 Ferritin-like protein 2 [Klebsiella pneumoniae]
MLKTDMIDKLNEQMNLELYSSLLYQQMSAWCSYHSFEGAAAFLRRHAQEEMTHMQRLFDYLTDTGSLPRINAIASPFAEYASLGNDSNLLIVFYVQIMPDDLVIQLHRF